MNDFPIPESCLFYEFRGDNNLAGTGTNLVRHLNIPNGVSMLYALLIGPGGAGGNGFTGAAGTARGGGGGGGSGAITRILIPAKILPPTIYVLPGQGGTNFAGTAVSSRITLLPATGGSSAVEDNIASASGGGNGGNGSGTGGGAAGTGGAAMAANGTMLGNFGLWVSVAGQNGIVGGAQTGAAGGAQTWGTGGIPISGGAAGGGVGTANTDFAGGALTGQNASFATRFPGMPNIAAGVAAAGNGNNGMSFHYGRGPIRACGGSGGGTAGAAGTGGRGGDGGFGSGGGGGGGGVTGGGGGNGGPGWIGIWMW